MNEPREKKESEQLSSPSSIPFERDLKTGLFLPEGVREEGWVEAETPPYQEDSS